MIHFRLALSGASGLFGFFLLPFLVLNAFMRLRSVLEGKFDFYVLNLKMFT
jgi:hypothetical protein